MALTQATVVDKVRKRLGLSETDLQQPVLEEAINAALVEFSRHRTNTVTGIMPILYQGSDYLFPSDVQEITDFFYAPQTILGNLSFEDEVLTAIQGNVINIDFGGNIFENPTLVTIWFSKMKAFRESIGLPAWRVMDDPVAGPMIRLGTIPSQDGTAYYEGKGPWTLGKIYTKDYEAFQKCVMWKTAESRANVLAVAKDYYEYGGVRVQPAFEYWDKRAKDYKEEFLHDVGFYRGIMSVG
jgi:hypothetical protein